MFQPIFLTVITVSVFSILFLFLGLIVIGTYRLIAKRHDYFINKRNDQLIFEIGLIICGSLLFMTVLFLLLYKTQFFLIVLTITLATMGWVLTNLINSRNSIRQHTVTILTQMRMSTEFMKNANKLQFLLENHTVIDFKYYFSLDDKDQSKESIRYILNYLEFVAAGIRLGDLDEQLVRSAQRGMFIKAFEMCEQYILKINSENPSTFEHLIATYSRWK